jgi:diguanylate cyclase (GGDEF)-like protein
MFSNPLNTEAALSKIFLISERLIIFDGIDDVFNHIVKTSVSLIGAEAATIRIFDVASGKLKIMKGYEVSQEFFSQPAMNIGEGISGRVVLEGKPFLTENLATEPHCINKEIAKLEGIKSFMCVPLKSREICIGTLSVYRKNKEAFTDYDMVMLNIFGMQAAEAIEKAKLVAELTKQATLDQLTGMYNKNAILSIIEKNLSLSSRYEMKSCVIFLDIDGFKGFNDTHGHLLGDKLLLDFATILKKMLRKSDSIGRFGGDEFVIIVPQTTKEQALHIVNKMKENVEEHNFIGKEAAKVKITFSAGIVAYPEGGNSVDELINKSDEALYQSKALGKNRVTLWSPH